MQSQIYAQLKWIFKQSIILSFLKNLYLFLSRMWKITFMCTIAVKTNHKFNDLKMQMCSFTVLKVKIQNSSLQAKMSAGLYSFLETLRESLLVCWSCLRLVASFLHLRSCQCCIFNFASIFTSPCPQTGAFLRFQGLVWLDWALLDNPGIFPILISLVLITTAESALSQVPGIRVWTSFSCCCWNSSHYSIYHN